MGNSKVPGPLRILCQVYAGHALYPSFESSKRVGLETRSMAAPAMVHCSPPSIAAGPSSRVESHPGSRRTRLQLRIQQSRVFPALADSLSDEANRCDETPHRAGQSPHSARPNGSPSTCTAARRSRVRTLNATGVHECLLACTPTGNVSANRSYLPRFLEQQGDAPEQRPLHDRTTAQISFAMVCDQWPSFPPRA